MGGILPCVRTLERPARRRRAMRSRYVVWGYGRSWIVHKVGASGCIVWCSEWMSSRADACNELQRLEARAAQEQRQ
ncbi:MAG: hypothetical protein B7X38_11075 [Stenotrophomonas sp. 14-69-23]|nr:MAG: hypothetical protein B7X38_11075 [Stenotrophomonas sp. 14-69-23]